MPLRSCKQQPRSAEASADIGHCFGGGRIVAVRSFRCGSGSAGIMSLPPGKAHVRLIGALLVRARREQVAGSGSRAAAKSVRCIPHAASGRAGRPRLSRTAAHGNNLEPGVDCRFSQSSGWRSLAPCPGHDQPGLVPDRVVDGTGTGGLAPAAPADPAWQAVPPRQAHAAPARSTGPGAQARLDVPDCPAGLAIHGIATRPSAIPALWISSRAPRQPWMPVPRPCLSRSDFSRRGRSSQSERSFQPS